MKWWCGSFQVDEITNILSQEKKNILAFRNGNETIVAILQKDREGGENYAKSGAIFIIIIIIWLHVSDLILQNLYLLNVMLGVPNGVKNT